MVKTDASAATGVAQRLGIGKTRHIEVNQLWLQEKVHDLEIRVVKVGAEENLADALTKRVGAADINKDAKGFGYETREDRRPLAPKVDKEEEEEEDEERDEEDEKGDDD